MLNVVEFYNALQDQGMNMFCGVPDSLLKELCSCITDKTDDKHNIIAANEGNALAIAAGHYLATHRPAVVYMQNSGEGNIVNPLLSLTDEEVYNIPVLIIIGWRGQPNIHDEPQHIKQGKLTLPLLKVIEVEYEILENISQIKRIAGYMQKTNKPFALIVKKGTFSEYPVKPVKQEKYSLKREEAIQEIISLIGKDDIVVSTTGMISRELYENRQTHERDFLTVGSMGHASSIAFGIALNKPNRKVFCFDGDGAFLMHMGAAAVIASRKLSNLKHIVFNNEAHDSVGGQPTVMRNVDLMTVAKGCGYQKVYQACSLEDINNQWTNFYNSAEPCLMEIKVKSGARKDLGRPKEKPVENKLAFMSFIED